MKQAVNQKLCGGRVNRRPLGGTSQRGKMWVGDIYNSKVEPRYRIEIGTSMHKEIVFLEDAEEFAISLLKKIGNFRHQNAAQQANGADATSKRVKQETGA